MEWREMLRRAYYEKYERIDVENDRGWYEVYRLQSDVYAIAEPRHFQEVNFFLIMGEDRALLLDTGRVCTALMWVLRWTKLCSKVVIGAALMVWRSTINKEN